MKHNIARVTHRKNANKQYVVDNPVYVEPTLRFFEVWQPHADAWFAAMEKRLRRNDTLGCLLKYLTRDDYKRVALVETYSFDDVYRIMNPIDGEEDIDSKVFILDPNVRHMSPGDVIVTDDGEPTYVAEFGFLSLPQVLKD